MVIGIDQVDGTAHERLSIIPILLLSISGEVICVEEEYLFDFNKIIAVPDSIDDTRDWCYENWGTDRYCFETYVSGNSILFSTAWTPCVPIIKAMSQMYPDVIIDYWYEESGMGFCGREVYLGGKPLYTEEADLEEHWSDDDDFEQFGYSEGYHDRQTQITEETSELKKGTFLTREDRDECVFITKGTFIDYGVDAYGNFIFAA